MKKVEIGFSQSSFDHWRLSKAGGSIHFKPNGKAVFRFDNKAQYDEYLRLNSERGKFAV